ncbi:hypothetical protein CDL15_Pgr027651 [Punica granatum]|uniref:Uncharacterized protein n=1 Tax=Punica granatum TaxID=22663 RepID=A0A218XIX5_PUNGR|nr:hypothetical protein CDL15_Pgr027651 [Punica granatum]
MQKIHVVRTLSLSKPIEFNWISRGSFGLMNTMIHTKKIMMIKANSSASARDQSPTHHPNVFIFFFSSISYIVDFENPGFSSSGWCQRMLVWDMRVEEAWLLCPDSIFFLHGFPNF